MPTPDPAQRAHAIRTTVAAARAIVTYHAGIPVGVSRLANALYRLNRFEPIDEGPVREYLRAVTGLPLGSERLEASREALERFDLALEPINQQYRNALFTFCYDLLDRFSAEAGPTPEVETRSYLRRRMR